ncbi:RagB/SusD family nutrient uptake outer membrane protein [Sphingobacterium chuzhouense]|uniref:RagB/SusD family nutrient uptake outer membrane protein n=1 Tax=Sphingobacterium chuzhouense TaxID=1742264 RepID=A0ABR7XW78_9SPHI|nr:RagB/SusD family nutrient uptake outer membrane protein [Sphingobacterium chuzhouense]MBD1423269.1 RagB/SusD family nutrient uptake outer membrane protein [Sphingobacterium chuzhouense]
MKKIFCYIAIGLLTGSITSCSKFLEENNLSGITAENFYTDVAGYESLVRSCYASLRSIYDINPTLFEYGTDIMTRGEIEPVSGTVGDLVIRATALNEYKTLTADNSAVDRFFKSAYSGIQRCNTAINRANDIPDLSNELRDRRLAEVRFIRAYYYYLLVENFGNVPIVEEEINTAITHFEPKSEQEVYQFIVSDLEHSVAGADITTSDFGRVTRDASKHLLSLIYLTRGYKAFGTATDFTKAAELAEEIIGAGVYTLQPTFSAVFDPENQQNKEVLFSVQYDPSSLKPSLGTGNGQNVLFGWRQWREAGFHEETEIYNRRLSDFMPTQFLYTLYDTHKDTRYDATFISQFYATKDDVKGNSPIQAGDLRFYFPYPDQEFSAEDEAELKASNPNVEVVRFDAWKQDFDGIGGKMKFPMIGKFFDPEATAFGNSENNHRSSRDIFIFRLSETYLIAAEACLKAGQAAKAAEMLNVVRNRAAVVGQSLSISVADVTIDFILDERAREQAGEYKRWLDLKRTRRLERAFEHNILTKMVNPSGTVDEKYYLRPIPQTVIDRDTEEYPQNDGY